MLSPYRMRSNSHKRRQNISNIKLNENSNREHNIKRPEVTSNDLQRPQKNKLGKPNSNADSAVNRTTNKKSKLKGGSMHEIDEINDEYLDKIFHKNNL